MHLRKHDVKNARREIRKDLRLRPENAETRAAHGDVLREMQQHSKALHEYEPALALDSVLATAFIGRAFCNYDKGSWGSAATDFHRGIALGWKDKNVKACLAKAEENMQ